MDPIHSRELAEAQYLMTQMRTLGLQLGEAKIDKYRADADETAMLALQLRQVRNRTYEDLNTILKARKFIPVNREVDPGAETYSFQRTEYVGEAKHIANGADDLPSVEVSGTEETYKLRSYGNSYSYSLQDMDRAAFSGQPLSARKAMAARRIWERKLDDVAFLGDGSISSGFGNDPNVSITALAAAGAWSTKTAQQMVDDANALVASVVTGSKEHYMADTLLMPTAQYLLFTQTRMATDTSETAAAAFLSANPQITMLDMWDKLDGAGGGASDRMVAYNRSPEVLELVIAREFTVMTPQLRNLAFVVPCHGRTGGTTVLRPLGLKYMDGI